MFPEITELFFLYSGLTTGARNCQKIFFEDEKWPREDEFLPREKLVFTLDRGSNDETTTKLLEVFLFFYRQEIGTTGTRRVSI